MMEGKIFGKDNDFVVRYQTETGEHELPLYHKDKEILTKLHLTEDSTEVYFEIVDEFSRPDLFQDVGFGDGDYCAKLI